MKARNLTQGFLSMLMGSALVFLTVVMINRYAEGPGAEEELSAAKIDFEKKDKPKPKKVVQQKKPPPPKPSRRPPTPLTGLNSNLAGLDLGLPGFSTDDLGDLSGDLLGGADDVVMTDDSVDEAPRPTRQSAMPYPPRAKAKGIEGYVMLSLLISPTGDVERVKLLEAVPAGVFDDVAITGVKGWKFEPATYKGESVRVWAKQRVRFDLS
ncbi:MAG: energy transducer TonB [Pseudomonadota bacterium]